MDASQLPAIGEHLFGKTWKPRMAKELRISVRHLFRFVNEDYPLGETLSDGLDVSDTLLAALHDHATQTQRLINMLHRSRRPKKG